MVKFKRILVAVYRPDAARGLAHMHALIAFAREHGASEVFPLDGAEGGAGATLTVLRSRLREGATAG